jgi:hypothetical protein
MYLTEKGLFYNLPRKMLKRKSSNGIGTEEVIRHPWFTTNLDALEKLDQGVIGMKNLESGSRVLDKQRNWRKNRRWSGNSIGDQLVFEEDQIARERNYSTEVKMSEARLKGKGSKIIRGK